jgi:hypothetical protein
MVTDNKEKIKEVAERIKMERDWPAWKVDEAAENCTLEWLEQMERKTRRLRLHNLDVRAKVNCMEQFLNIMIPYAPEWDDETDLDDLVATIDEWVGEQYYFDRDGNWYDEGRRVRA